MSEKLKERKQRSTNLDQQAVFVSVASVRFCIGLYLLSIKPIVDALQQRM